MKKTITLFASLLLLAGCASSTSSSNTISTAVENANEVVVSNQTGLKITNQDIYAFLLENYGAAHVLDSALQEIASTANIDEEELKASLTQTKEMYESFVGDVDDYAKNYLGYNTFDEYLNEYMLPNLRVNKLIETYINENKETLTAQNNFAKLRMITVESQEEAMALISKLLAKEITFEDAYAQNSIDTSKENGELGVVSSLSSTLDENIKMILPSLKTVALYSVPVQLNNGNFAIIDIMDIDTANMTEEIDSALLNSTEVATQAQAALLKEHNFKVYDDSLKEAIKLVNYSFINE